MTTPRWWRRDIHPGDTGSDVDTARRLLFLPPGPWDATCVHRVRSLEKAAGDVLTASLAEAIGETVLTGIRPSWWHRRLARGMSGDDVTALRERLELEPGEYDQECEDAVRRWQSAQGLTPTGVVDESLAIELGE